jgi:Sigma-70, region 4
VAFTIRLDGSIVADTVEETIALWKRLRAGGIDLARPVPAPAPAVAAPPVPSPLPHAPPAPAAAEPEKPFQWTEVRRGDRRREAFKDEIEPLRPFFASLAPRQRELIELRMGGLWPSDIAAKLGMTAGSVSAVICEAKKRLRVARDAGVNQPPKELRAFGSGTVVPNGQGYRWQFARGGRKYTGPTVKTRELADSGLVEARAAIDRGEEPIVAARRAKRERPGAPVMPAPEDPPAPLAPEPTIVPISRLRQRAPTESKTFVARDLTPVEMANGRELEIPPGAVRPKTRGDCADGPRPCPWVRCRYHLYVDVDPKTGAMTMNFPGVDLDELPETCALDVADRGGAILEEIGTAFNLTRERIRQIEMHALKRAGKASKRIPGVELPDDDGAYGHPLAMMAQYG